MVHSQLMNLRSSEAAAPQAKAVVGPASFGDSSIQSDDAPVRETGNMAQVRHELALAARQNQALM